MHPHRFLGVLGLLAMALLYVLLVLLSGRAFNGIRFDLTQNHVHTLAPGTVRIARSLQQPIHLALFFSRHASRDQPRLRAYEQRVLGMLKEIQRHTHGMLQVRVLNPSPYSEAEDRALAYGLTPMPGGVGGARTFFGLVGTNGTTGLAVLPFLQPDKEAFLEYDIARMLYELSSSRQPVVGLITGLSLDATRTASASQGIPRWSVLQQLRKLFHLQILDPTNLHAIPADVRVLLLVQPSNLTATARQAVEAYLQRGGHLALFLDPDPQTLPSAYAALSAKAAARAVAPLLTQWGIAFNPDQVVLDPPLARSIQLTPGRRTVRDPALIGLGRAEISHDDVTTAGLSSINILSAGTFEQLKHAPLRLMPLLQSGPDSGLVSAARVIASHNPQTLLDGFHTGIDRYVIAGRLIGPLKPGAAPADIIVVADTDILSDRLWVQWLPFFGQTLASPFANNGDFFLNVVDNLSGSSALISIRGRAVSVRPFTRLQALRTRAAAAYREHKLALEQQLNAVQRQVLSIEHAGSSLTTALQAQRPRLAELNRNKEEIRRQLRRIERHLNARIQNLQANIMLIDSVLIPVLLSLLALLVALVRSWRRHWGQDQP